MGIYTVGCPFSLEGEGWDEGEYNQLILLRDLRDLRDLRGEMLFLESSDKGKTKSCPFN
jgi:hypothetical protein